MALDKFGFPQGFQTPAMLKDIENATQQVQNLKDQWAKDGFGVAEIEEFANSFIGDEAKKGLISRVAAANSPNNRAEGLATLEGEAVHIISAAQVQLEKAFQEKIPLFKPDDEVQSAIKGMQITIDNMSAKMNDSLQSLGNFADAAVMPPMDMESMMKDAAEINSKYMKVVFDKMNEFTNKKLNSELSKVVAAMPASKRSMFADMKQVLNQDTLKQFSGISDGIGGMMEGVLGKTLNLDSLKEQAMSMVNNPITPSASGFMKNWIPGMSVKKGEKIKFRNNVFTVGKSGKTGTTLPNTTVESQDNGNVSLTFDSYATGDSAEDTTLYGDVRTHPRVPICYAENIMAQAIAGNKGAIDEANNNIIKSMNAFIEDMSAELGEMEQKSKPRARDASNDGKVVTISDEEGLGDDQGGSFYVTMVDAGTTSTGSVRNRGVGIASTAQGPGSGLTVDIVVTEGGATGTTDGETYIKLLTGGSGYNDGATPVPSTTGTNTNQNTTGGSGTGCKANITYASGVGTKVTITECQGGTGYKKDDILTITGANGGSGCTFQIIKPRGRIDQFGITINKPGHGYEMGEFVTVDRETYCSTSPDATFTVSQTTNPGPKSIEAPKSGKGKPQSLGSIMSKLGGLGGSLSSALNFKNVVGNVFPFELPPNPPVADFFTLAKGGGGLPDGQLPSINSLAQGAIGDSFNLDGLNIPTELPFALPSKDMPDIGSMMPDIGGMMDNIESGGDDVDYLSTSLTQEQREDIRNDPNINIGY